MNSKFKFICSVSIIFISFLFLACSSSSSTRYDNQNESSNDKEQHGRFSSEDDNVNIKNGSEENTDLTNESEDLPDDDEVSLPDNLKNFESELRNSDAENVSRTPREKVLMEIIKYINTPYKYGGNTKKGIDCSAFTQQVYKNTLSVDLNRSASGQYLQGEEIGRIEDLKFGDLVFFNTGRNVKPGHVGIYIGENLFAHASTKKGVTISSLNHSYYHSRFMGGRRISSAESF